MKKFLSFILNFIVLLSLLSTTALASDTTSEATFSYIRSGKWNNFNGTVTDSNYIDGIKIQTDSSKNYYLQYRTWNENQTWYFSDVKSTVDDFAGSTKGLRIQRLGISVKSKSDNSSIDAGIVVMYRVLVNGLWLPWVSNASSDWMDFVQRKYGLNGVLDYNSGYAGIDGSYITGIEIHIYEESSIINSKGTAGDKKVIDAPFISQSDSYPTGCESVSTVMALNHLGLETTVDNFIDNHLEKGSAESFDPNLCFGGDPRSTNGMGCYSPVIEKAAKSISDGFGIKVTRLSGATLNELCKTYIDNNIPVILWATQDMTKAYNGKKISYNSTTIQWIAPEHCLLLIGYDENNYIFNDPLKSKNTIYSRNAVENAYYALGAQAVILLPASPEFTPKQALYYSLPNDVYSPEIINLSDGSYTKRIEFFQNPYVCLNYNSNELATGHLGIGWHFNFEKSLQETDEGIKIYDNPSCYSLYTQNSDGVYRSFNAGKSGYILRKNANSQYELNCNFNKTEIYDTNGRLCEIRDKHGYSIFISYTDSQITLTDSNSATVSLSLDINGRITEISNTDATIQLKYTANVLTEIFGTDSYSLRYSENTRLISIIKNGEKEVINYNSDQRAVKISGKVHLEITYSSNTATLNDCIYTFDSNGMLTSYTVGNETTVYSYDNELKLTEKTDSSGTVSYKYHSFNRVSSVIGADFAETLYIYDENANLIKIIHPLKGDVNFDGSITLLDFIRLKKHLANSQNITVSTYNSNFDGDEISASDLTELTKILFTETKFTAYEEYFYNERNQLIKHIDKNGNITEY